MISPPTPHPHTTLLIILMIKFLNPTLNISHLTDLSSVTILVSQSSKNPLILMYFQYFSFTGSLCCPGYKSTTSLWWVELFSFSYYSSLNDYKIVWLKFYRCRKGPLPGARNWAHPITAVGSFQLFQRHSAVQARFCGRSTWVDSSRVRESRRTTLPCS